MGDCGGGAIPMSSYIFIPFVMHSGLAEHNNSTKDV